MRSLLFRWYHIATGALLFAVLIGPWIDRKMPVVDPFVVVHSTRVGDVITVEGWMEKLRDCSTLEVYVVARSSRGARVVDIEFLDRSKPDLVSRPTGVQFWGPWRVSIPADAQTLHVRTRHSCHPFWDTVGEKLLWEKAR